LKTLWWPLRQTWTITQKVHYLPKVFMTCITGKGQDADGNYIYDRDLAGENLRNLNNISLAGGLRNGDLAKDLYSMWRLPAYMNNNYSNQNKNNIV
jgi:hypothetical protein